MPKRRAPAHTSKAKPGRQALPARRMVTQAMIPVRGRYDAAQTTSDNARHWAMADALSADASASPAVRKNLRMRCRYEVANNSYARGVVETLANDTIGTGPRVQMLGLDETFNKHVEIEYAKWCAAVHRAEKLRTGRKARAQDGEAFALMGTNPGLRTPVKLDITLIEADRVTSPGMTFVPGKAAVDGVHFDEYGNPTVYDVLRTHPGGDYTEPGALYDEIAARYVIHWFRKDRPEQRRGLPDIMPALPLFALLRRYGLAVISAAESAANISAILATTLPASGTAAEVEQLSTIEFARNMMLVAPEGWSPSQMRAEQPSTTYDMGKREFLKEIGRCLNMPYCVVAGDSSDYNYASGRLDFQTYFRSISVDQSGLEETWLDPEFAEWAAEAQFVYPWWPADAVLNHQWFWDGREHVDPLKEAAAQEIKLRNHTTSLAREYGKLGLDWEPELEQLAREAAKCRALGLPLPWERTTAPAADPATDPNAEDEEPMSKRKSGGNGNGRKAKMPMEGANRVKGL